MEPLVESLSTIGTTFEARGKQCPRYTLASLNVHPNVRVHVAKSLRLSELILRTWRYSNREMSPTAHHL
jgi:hypothetical protein